MAAAYERFRPGYPDELVDEVFAYAARPIRSALEIGAGTGKATRLFARRDIEVTATDPDPAMLEELTKHVGGLVVTVLAAFEELSPTSAYDLVFAAASLHWTNPDERWSRVASMLTPRGTFAAFGGQRDLADADVQKAVRNATSPFLPDDDVPSPDATPPESPMQWPGTELERSDLFTDVRQSVIERRVILSADQYVGHLSTVSAYLMLAKPVREQALDAIVAVLPARVAVDADITLHLARLRS